ncbi:hypothetical protein RHSIM_Rhsim02G0051000 [Rhododendron simsii]|uniref:GDT1 family protein n=1 Tax=Rhododendron simsii TaxID=118357 RepID=A0A834LZ35_RHOSS|nr:hypothetical protein RHSIM_Rhsim02G0051000 [Rhododendron simsii]
MVVLVFPSLQTVIHSTFSLSKEHPEWLFKPVREAHYALCFSLSSLVATFFILARFLLDLLLVQSLSERKCSINSRKLLQLQLFTAALERMGRLLDASTIALGAAQSPWGVASGAIVGHLLATSIAILGGGFLANYISEKLRFRGDKCELNKVKYFLMNAKSSADAVNISCHKRQICRPCDVFPYKIEVDAPSLLYIKAMKDLSSQLVEARIDFELCPKQSGDVYEKSLLELLEGISNVQTLHIPGDCIQATSMILGR